VDMDARAKIAVAAPQIALPRFDVALVWRVPTYACSMAVLLFPLQGAVLIITLAITVVTFIALLGVASQSGAGFVAAEKQTKLFWIMVLVLGMFVPIVGIIAAIVYFVDVRPAVRSATPGARGGGSSSDGPYGPSRR
jgi:Protein of unknown function (DUF2516)